jgi:D,D-heptose 1,7-bisphosphate phosphatase
MPLEDKQNKAVFLDRDGVIIVDKEYLSDPAGVELMEGAVEGLRLLREHGYKIIIISGQSGVGRGYYTKEQAESVHQRILEEFAKNGVGVDDAYYCYHTREDHCKCRKPQPTHVLEAAKKYGVDLGKSFMAGDKPSDLETGRNASPEMKTVLIGEKKGEPLLPEQGHLADYKAKNLLEAAQWIVGQENR